MNQRIHNTALIVIDAQRGFDDPAWGRRNNPQAEGNIAILLAAWRAVGLPVVHVHHDSLAASGKLRHGTPGHLVKSEATPTPTERVYRKSVNNAFIGTHLEAGLRDLGIASVVIVGLTTNHCVSTSARMAANLGFATTVVSDATATFDRAALDGRLRPAAEVHDAALSDLQGEFATILETDRVTAMLASHAVTSNSARG